MDHWRKTFLEDNRHQQGVPNNTRQSNEMNVTYRGMRAPQQHPMNNTVSTCDVGKPLEALGNLGKPWETSWNRSALQSSGNQPNLGYPRKTLGTSWNGFWEHLGRSQAAGRPERIYNCRKVAGKTLESRLGNLGKRWKPVG